MLHQSCPALCSDAQLAFEFTPRPDADVSKRVIDFLRSEPSADDMARETVLQFLAPFDARASVISAVEHDATLRVIGTFGIPERAGQHGSCSVWDDFPSAAAVRLRRPVVATCPDQCAREFPVVRQLGLPDLSVAAIPLMTSASTVGAMSVYFVSEGSTVQAAAHTMQAIADVYVLYLASTSIERPHTPAHDVAHCCESTALAITSHMVRPVTKRDLTKRQYEVLALLSEEMTYDQIASRIGYSHSTVREELMQIYRLLGVHSRREAVREAIQRGILSADANAPAEMKV